MQIVKKIAIAAIAVASFAGSASASVVQSTSGSFWGSGGQHVMGSVTFASGTNDVSALTTSTTLVDQGWGGSDPSNGVYVGLFEGANLLWYKWVAGAGHSWSTQNYNIANDLAALATLNTAMHTIDWTGGQPVTMSLVANSWGYPGWQLHVSSSTLSVTSANVPEPASIALLGLGIAGIGAARRKSKKA